MEDLRAFPDDARRHVGYQLRRLQQGLQPDDAKPMASVGAGVAEIRIHTGVGRKPMTTKIRRSSGNVFRDLGFGTEEAANLKLRADLMIELSRVIKARRLTQAKAAALFGVSQPRISDLTRGKIERFSVDTLVAMLGHAGRRVDLVVRPRSRVA